MLKTEQIVRLNSNDVSEDPNRTREVVSKLWAQANNEKKKKAVAMGGYQDTRSFSPVRNKGNISARMTVTLAQVFGVDPFYIVGQEKTDAGFSEERLNKFLKEFGFEEFITRKPVTIDNLINLAAEIIKGVEPDNLKNLSEEEIVNLVKATITQEKVGNLPAVLKLELIKRVLVY